MAAPDHGPRGNKRSKPREQVASSMDEDGALSLTSNRPIRKDFLQIRTRFKASSTSGDKGDDLGNALGKPCQMGHSEQRRWQTDGGKRMVAAQKWKLNASRAVGSSSFSEASSPEEEKTGESLARVSSMDPR